MGPCECNAFYDYYSNFFKFKRNIINTLNFSYIHDRIKQIRLETKLNKKMNDELNKSFTNDEVLSYINSSKFKKKLNKSVHWDKISNKFIQAIALHDCDSLTSLLNMVLKCGKIPKQWRTDKLTPILKKLPTTRMKNWRPIMIQPSLFKLLDALLQARMASMVIPQLNPEQSGFLPGRSTMEQLMTLRIALTHYNKRIKRKIYLLQLDLESAFPTVFINGMLIKLHEYGIDGPVWTLLDDSYKELKSSVNYNGILTEPFNIERGVHQGGNTSPMPCFAVYIDSLITKLKTNDIGIEIGEYTISSLAFADDLIVLTNTITEMQ